MHKGLYTVEDFNITAAKEYLTQFKDKFIFTENMTVEDINNSIEELLIILNTYEKRPKFVITRALYSDDDGKLTYARFIIRPSISYDLNVKDMRKVITITSDSEFFNNLIRNVAEWFDNYTYYAQIETNITILNLEVQRIINENNIDIDLSFSLGDGIKEISDNSITVGLKEEVIKNISKFALFSEELIWKLSCEKEFINILKECGRPYDILKLKSEITKELCIYQRKSINKLIRQIVTRRIDYVRVGVGYSEDEERFSVIQREAVSDEELCNYNTEEIIITKNENMTSNEKKSNLTNIVTYFKVMPFYKKTGVPIEINIKDFLDETKVVD